MSKVRKFNRYLLKCSLLVLMAVVSLTSVSYAWETLDRVIAVVGNRVILQSELEFQIQLYAVQTGQQIEPGTENESLRKQILDQMINDRLILIKALEDTTIFIEDEEVAEALDQRLDDLRSQFPTEKAFEDQLAVEGFTLRDLKNKLRTEIRDQLYKDRLINKLLSRISVTRPEVENFYERYRDSLPDVPRTIEVAHLLLKPETSSATADSLKQLANSLIERIKAGESFETLAREYSQDPSAEQGGDIGTFQRGDLVPEYERAALALQPGEVSNVVKTEFGYHIIKLVGKTENNFHTKHILLLESATAADSSGVETKAHALIDSLEAGADWGEIVKNHSDDSTTRANFGELGELAPRDLPPSFREPLQDLKAGEISEPFWSPSGLHIVKVLDRHESRQMTIENDYDLLKRYARQEKTSDVISTVVNEMKDKVYIDRRRI